MKSGLIIFGLFLFFLAGLADASVVQFVFTTEPQTIEPAALSDAITIQSRDANGDKTNTNETIDLEFFSTSQSGEFLNSSGNPASKVMSKNTANRTFYYRDSASGVFTLTVKAAGRESGQTWQASQQIAVSAPTVQQAGEQEYQNQSFLYDQQFQNSPTSNPQPQYRAEIIGGDKVAVAGAALNFEGAVFVSSGEPREAENFLWAFGDGAYAKGRFASHAYDYPGKYIVFLNAAVSGLSLGNSIVVSVIGNAIEISELKPGKNGWIEIVNDSDFKIDISHWAVSNGQESFYFPKNTFIGPKIYLVLPRSISGIEFFPSGAAFILYPRGRPADEFSYSGFLASGESFHDIDGSARIGFESPSSARFVERAAKNPNKPSSDAKITLPAQESIPTDPKSEEIDFMNAASALKPVSGENNFTNSAKFWLFAALGFGIFGAFAYLLIKRKGLL